MDDLTDTNEGLPTGHSRAPGGRAGQLASSGLRPGWTTGACAAAAARAAYTALLMGDHPDPVTVQLPGGRRPAFALTSRDLGDGWASAAVTKDSGDDPDVTHGAVVRVRVSVGRPGAGLTFTAGPGVGLVTLPGLPLPVGEPAINPMPRRMIADNLAAVARGYLLDAGLSLQDEFPAGTDRPRALPGVPEAPWDAGSLASGLDLNVEVGIDDGEALARHTLNPRLGIVGGLSVLGTTGVVVPYSCSAWIDSIHRGVDVAIAVGCSHVAACTGSTSERVARERYGLPDLALLDMGDFAGAVLKYLRAHPVARLTICGGVAKLSKLATGHLDLHSGRSSIDTAFLASLARDGGAGHALAAAILASTTVLGAVTLAHEAAVPLGDLIAAAARDQALHVLAGAPVEVGVVCLDRAGAVLGKAP
ncbi:MAG: cobalt-precorrin-5B (C(1))-methyltransferase [Dermatophilaceae bacterium]